MTEFSPAGWMFFVLFLTLCIGSIFALLEQLSKNGSFEEFLFSKLALVFYVCSGTALAGVLYFLKFPPS